MHNVSIRDEYCRKISIKRARPAKNIKPTIHRVDTVDMRKFFLLTAILLLAACKNLPPQPEKMPFLTLAFDRIEGIDIHRVVLYYHFKAENPRPASMTMTVHGGKTIINTREIDPLHAVLKSNGAIFSSAATGVAAGETREMEFELHLDLKEIIQAISGSGNEGAAQADSIDTFITKLALEASCQYGEELPAAVNVSAVTEFPRIWEPEFSINSIAIMQAELINTRFTVTLRINNRNPFPVTLSSFDYELYGHGMFWADGKERNILTIPAKSGAETKLFLIMNFINMKRSLLDEIIAMRQVNYRLKGAAEVITGIEWLPRFSMQFDKSGYSEVVE
jgi:LEA14-like dessication related protein